MKHYLQFLLLFALAFQAAPMLAQQPAPNGSTPDTDYLELSRSLLDKYYETEKLLGKERADWRLGKELLQSRLELMEAQLKDLKSRTEEESGKITESDTQRLKLEEQSNELAKTQDLQIEAVEKMEKRVRSFWPLLPEILQSKLSAQYERMPSADLPRTEVRTSVGERFLAVLAIYNEATKFHNEVTVVSERRRLASGQELEVDTMYIGLAVGYFASNDPVNPVAGMLLPGKEAWEVIEMPEIASAVRDSIDMNKSAKLASFVPLPVQVR